MLFRREGALRGGRDILQVLSVLRPGQGRWGYVSVFNTTHPNSGGIEACADACSNFAGVYTASAATCGSMSCQHQVTSGHGRGRFFPPIHHGYYSKGYDAYATDCADLCTKVCPINFERNPIYQNSSVCCSIFNSDCCSLDPRIDMPWCQGDQAVEDQCNSADCTGLPDKRVYFWCRASRALHVPGHRRSSFVRSWPCFLIVTKIFLCNVINSTTGSRAGATKRNQCKRLKISIDLVVSCAATGMGTGGCAPIKPRTRCGLGGRTLAECAEICRQNECGGFFMRTGHATLPTGSATLWPGISPTTRSTC